MIRVLTLAVILLLSSCDSSEESLFPELREADELAAQLNAEEDFGFELHTSHWGSAPAIHVKVSDPENDPQVILKRIREAKGESTDGLLLVVRTDKFPYKGEWRERGENSQNISSFVGMWDLVTGELVDDAFEELEKNGSPISKSP